MDSMDEKFPTQTNFPYLQPKVKMLPLKEQPAYRVSVNAETCNLAELLAVIIGGNEQIETAERLLARFGSVHKLAQAHVNEIASLKGVGTVTALRLKAALALGRKLLEPQEDRPEINSPARAAEILMPRLSLLQQEYLVTLLLDTRNRFIEFVEVYRGSLNSSTVRIGEVYRAAIQQSAAGIVISHNHPSGDPTPSPEDVAVTRAIVQAGKLLDINCLDHLIIGQGRWISLKEKGLGFS
jgi:DNA repair protein RadC